MTLYTGIRDEQKILLPQCRECRCFEEVYGGSMGALTGAN